MQLRILGKTLLIHVECPATRCDRCLFRFKCLTQREPEILVEDISELSSMYVSDNVMAEMHVRDGYLNYEKLFHLLVERC